MRLLLTTLYQCKWGYSMNIDYITMKKIGENYRVTDFDEIIEVDEDEVEKILSRLSNADTEDIVLLLAVIESSRLMSAEYDKTSKKITMGCKLNAIPKLLSHYPVYILIYKLNGLKYCSIRKILESKDPVNEMETIS